MIPVGSFGLGCWQVYRLQWKLGLIDMMQSKTNATPVPMPSELVSWFMYCLSLSQSKYFTEFTSFAVYYLMPANCSNL